VSAAQIATLRARFEQQAREYCARSPLYGEICRAVARDDETLALMLHAPEHSAARRCCRRPSTSLLLAGTDHELAAHVTAPTSSPSTCAARRVPLAAGVRVARRARPRRAPARGDRARAHRSAGRRAR
jgi:hypothetical protein